MTDAPAHARSAAPDATLSWRADWPLELVRLLAPLKRGRFDPCHVVTDERTVWRTSRMPAGAVVARLRRTSGCDLEVHAWGPGAEQFVASVPGLLGEADEPRSFRPDHPLLEKLHRAHGWMRMPRTGLVFEAFTSAVLEQRVTTTEAFRARSWLLRRYGEQPPAAPGVPDGMRVCPPGEVWARIPSWEWHQAGVDVHRAATLKRCAEVAERLNEVAGFDKLRALQRMRAVPGVGVWTCAEVRQRALGDADAVSFGDVHLARFVGYALAGHEVDDDGMLELLEPWRGHRHRVVRLLQLGAALGAVQGPPKVPRARPREHLGF